MTFSEWFNLNSEELEKLEHCIIFDYGDDAYLSDESLRNIAKYVWKASRQNMTTKDI